MKTLLRFGLKSFLAVIAALVLIPAVSRAATWPSCSVESNECGIQCALNYPGDNPEYPKCTKQCLVAFNLCDSTADYYSGNFHNWELLSGQSNQELKICRQVAHRAAYMKCYSGKYFYNAQAYQQCRASGSHVVDCCSEQENLYDNDNCVPF